MRISLLLIGSFLFGVDDAELLNRIKESGKVIDASSIVGVKDPFFGESRSIKGSKETNVTKYEPTFSLKAIFGNKALINNRWVAKGEVLEGYTLVEIGQKEVYLIRDGEKKIASLSAPKVAW